MSLKEHGGYSSTRGRSAYPLVSLHFDFFGGVSEKWTSLREMRRALSEAARTVSLNEKLRSCLGSYLVQFSAYGVAVVAVAGVSQASAKNVLRTFMTSILTLLQMRATATTMPSEAENWTR